MPDDFPPSSPTPEAHASADTGVNFHLSASLRADFEALQNDFEQANAMAQDLQCQLAGKSNDFAQLKHVFEKTHRNLTQLQKDIEELREERHRLANEAMRATSLELLLQKAASDRDVLQQKLEKQTREQNELVAKLTAELEGAKEQAAALPRPPQVVMRGNRIANPKAAHILKDIVKAVDQLRTMIDTTETPAPPRTTPNVTPEPEFIDISFSG